jgi:hypothetical protein
MNSSKKLSSISGRFVPSNFADPRTDTFLEKRSNVLLAGAFASVHRLHRHCNVLRRPDMVHV